MLQTIPLSKINVRGGTQTRATIHDEVVDDYAEKLESQPAMLPPPDVFHNDGEYLMADGFHRFYAAKKLGLKTLRCNVHTGGFQDALSFSLASNQKHGLRRSAEDKRRSVELAIREWPKSSDRQIADMCGVGHPLVASVRSVLVANDHNEPALNNPTLGGRSSTALCSKNLSEPNGQQELPHSTESKPNVITSPITPSSTKPNGVVDAKVKQRPLDETGTPIPDEAIPFWNRRQEVQNLLTEIISLKAKIKLAKDAEDPMYGNVSNAAIDQLSAAYQHVSEAKPYAVCTSCQGVPSFQPKGCSMCSNTGLISKWRWDTASRQEVKEMRSKVNAARAVA